MWSARAARLSPGNLAPVPRTPAPNPGPELGSTIAVRCSATTGSADDRHHPQPVPGRVLDQHGHHVPGRMGVEMPVDVPHHPGDQGGVQSAELTRETMRDMINRDALEIGGHHHRQRAAPPRRRSITQPVHSHTHQQGPPTTQRHHPLAGATDRPGLLGAPAGPDTRIGTNVQRPPERRVGSVRGLPPNGTPHLHRSGPIARGVASPGTRNGHARMTTTPVRLCTIIVDRRWTKAAAAGHWGRREPHGHAGDLGHQHRASPVDPHHALTTGDRSARVRRCAVSITRSPGTTGSNRPGPTPSTASTPRCANR